MLEKKRTNQRSAHSSKQEKKKKKKRLRSYSSHHDRDDSFDRDDRHDGHDSGFGPAPGGELCYFGTSDSIGPWLVSRPTLERAGAPEAGSTAFAKRAKSASIEETNGEEKGEFEGRRGKRKKKLRDAYDAHDGDDHYDAHDDDDHRDGCDVCRVVCDGHDGRDRGHRREHRDKRDKSDRRDRHDGGERRGRRGSYYESAGRKSDANFLQRRIEDSGPAGSVKKGYMYLILAVLFCLIMLLCTCACFYRRCARHADLAVQAGKAAEEAEKRRVPVTSPLGTPPRQQRSPETMDIYGMRLGP